MPPWIKPAFLALGFSTATASAQSPWPGEAWTQSVNLTSLAALDWQSNLSGAFWNPVRRHLWVVDNSGYFHRLVEGGPLGFQVDTAGGKPAKWVCGGDAEAITQSALGEPSVLVLNEDGYIEEYSTAVPGSVRKLHSWDIRSVAAPVDGSGPEGIAFVPDASLAAGGFTGKDGKPYASRHGMGGLLFVAHQDGGEVHVFDCGRTGNALLHVGSFATGRDESSDLAFDASLGLLYVWHNTGKNSLEAVRLSSTDIGGGRRRLEPVAEFTGPKGGNLEGMAMTPASSGENWYFATDDDNQDGHALMWFKAFKPGLIKPVSARRGSQFPGTRGNGRQRANLPQVDGRRIRRPG